MDERCNHCISKALVCGNPDGTLFVLEDLTGIRSATERVRVKDRYVQVSWAYYDLEKKLEYKAAMHGSRVVKMDRANTSQTCPICGQVDGKSRKRNTHTFKCTACGYTTNDDRAAEPSADRKKVPPGGTGAWKKTPPVPGMTWCGGAQSAVPIMCRHPYLYGLSDQPNAVGVVRRRLPQGRHNPVTLFVGS